MKSALRALLAALLAAPLALAQTLPDLGDVAQADVTPRDERRIGEAIMREIRADPAYLDDAEATDYLNSLGYKLVSVSADARQAFDFFLIRDPSVNAFALPGGFIGVHTGLFLASQSESELAAVVGHEVGHVVQRHIARQIARQKDNSVLTIAALALAVLAARSNPELASAAIVGAQAGAIQSQLNFTRDNEREADRVGIQILDGAGFDPQAMPAFFERLQKATRIVDTGAAPAYLRTHPLTYERMADMQGRADQLKYRQVPDSLEFLLVRAKLRVLTDSPREAVQFFEESLKARKFLSETATRYGLTEALYMGKQYARAQAELAQLVKIAPSHPMIATLSARIALAVNEAPRALAIYREALARFPNNRGLTYGYIDALLRTGDAGEALKVIEARQRVSDDYQMYFSRAKAYAELKRTALSHQALAEGYLRMGNPRAAVEQLTIAQKAGDASFQELSIIESRLRELRRLEEQTKKER
ncbi:MAG: M48 family metalloprotease [Burkholderiales bacterium]